MTTKNMGEATKNTGQTVYDNKEHGRGNKEHGTDSSGTFVRENVNDTSDERLSATRTVLNEQQQLR